MSASATQGGHNNYKLDIGLLSLGRSAVLRSAYVDAACCIQTE